MKKIENPTQDKIEKLSSSTGKRSKEANKAFAINKGSVITKDAGVALLANLSTVENQKQEVFPLLLK